MTDTNTDKFLLGYSGIYLARLSPNTHVFNAIGNLAYGLF
jgi:hypothetical protein